MALWAHLYHPRWTWKALCQRRNSKKSTARGSPQSRSDSTATTLTNSAGLVLATTAQPNAVPSAAASSPISSESAPSSSTTRTSSTRPRSPSSIYPSILPASTSSLIPTTSSPPSSPPSGAGTHTTFVAPTTPIAGHMVSHLADRLAGSSRKAKSQHDYLSAPLRQLLQACRPCCASLDGPDPTPDITDALAQLHNTLLAGVLEVMAKLSLLEASLRRIDAVGTRLLATIEREIEGVAVLTRKLRRFEERVRRFLRVNAVRGGGRREVIEKARDKFSPDMRDLICRMNLLGVRVQFMNLQLMRVLGSSGVPRERNCQE